jgi:glyoxylate/hydroxypyruvate reductase A
MTSPIPVAYFSVDDPVEPWRHLCRELALPVQLREWPAEIEDPAAVEAAFVWHAPPAMWADLPNLRFVQTIGTGVDHLLAHPPPASVTLARTVDPTLTEQMAEYAILAVLACHRSLHYHLRNQKQGVWGTPPYAETADTPVGVMGTGEIGGAILQRLRAFQFPLRAWSRTGRTGIEGVNGFQGLDGLAAFLAGTRILLSVLPATAATDGLLDGERLRQLPRGAHVVNLGRGSTIVERDLEACLASGHLASCFLDVFAEEPLSPASPFWQHPQVIVTPHAAGVNFATPYAARLLADNLARVLAGQPPQHGISSARGY